MSSVYYSYIDKLAEAIVNPSNLALSFQAKGIIGRDVQVAITDKGGIESAQDRTLRLLNAVGKHVSAFPDKLATVAQVFHDDKVTARIAAKMAEDG